MIKKLFYPFYNISKKEKTLLYTVQIVLALVLLQFLNLKSFPKPSLILSAILDFLFSAKFYDNLISTFLFLCIGFLITIALTLFITYLSTFNAFKLLTEFVVKCRYIPFSCVIFMFTQNADNVDELKYYLLIFGLVPYFCTSYIGIVNDVITNGKEINKSLINRNNFFETLYEVIIIGKIDKVFDVIRQNFAISWTIITTVEGIAISSGGIGTLILANQKHLKMEEIIALGVIILLIGIGFDSLISLIKRLLISY